MNYKEFFKGKNITVMGLGLLGRGLGDVKFLAECGADLLVTDLKSATELEPTLAQLKEFKNIKYVLGEHRLEDFRNRDMIIKNAGVPLDSPFIAEARKNKIPVEMDESLFVKLAPKDITTVGITGTRGKTTVTTLIYEILECAHKKLGDKKQVFLAGNIKGVATLPMLSKVKSGDIVIMELSSWQLQSFGESNLSPHISVFTNFLDDHLNYYKNKREDYFKDKSYIYTNQKESDFLVVSESVLKLIEAGKIVPKSKVIVPKELPEGFKINIPGEHNIENAKFAVEVAKIFKIEDKVIKEALENFKGVSGRLELVKRVDGVRVYNDTTSTTPDALVVALESLGKKVDEKTSEEKNLVLIMGGADKNLDFKSALEKIQEHCKAVILIPGTGTERVKEDIKKFKSAELAVVESNTLEEAVKQAFDHAKSGDRILFSPGFASFGMFKNEYDRGDKFNEILDLLLAKM